MDALERLLAITEQKLGSLPVEDAVDPLAGLSPKEIRRRFDESGNPREGFDIDGNPTTTETTEDKSSDEPSHRAKALRERANKRRTRWE